MLSQNEIDLFNKRISYFVNGLVNDIVNNDLVAVHDNKLIKNSIIECIDNELIILEGIALSVNTETDMSNQELLNVLIQWCYTFSVDTFSVFPDYVLNKIEVHFNNLYEVESQFENILRQYLRNNQ